MSSTTASISSFELSATQLFSKNGWVLLDVSGVVEPSDLIDLHKDAKKIFVQSADVQEHDVYESKTNSNLFSNSIISRIDSIKGRIQNHLCQTKMFEMILPVDGPNNQSSPLGLSANHSKMTLLRNKQQRGSLTPWHTDAYAILSITNDDIKEASVFVERIDDATYKISTGNVLMECPYVQDFKFKLGNILKELFGKVEVSLNCRKHKLKRYLQKRYAKKCLHQIELIL